MSDLPVMAVGDTPLDTWTLVDTSNNPISLVGTPPPTFNLIMRNFRTGIKKGGAGRFTILNAPGGQVSYAWDSGDTSVSGIYRLSVQVVWSNGTSLTFGLIDQVNQTILAP